MFDRVLREVTGAACAFEAAALLIPDRWQRRALHGHTIPPISKLCDQSRRRWEKGWLAGAAVLIVLAVHLADDDT